MIDLNNAANMAMDHIYLVPRTNESDGDYVKRVGIVTAKKHLKPAAVEAATSALNEAGYSPAYGQVASSAISAIDSAASTYARTGDTGKALQAGAVAGGMDYAKKYATKHVAGAMATEGAKKLAGEAGKVAFDAALKEGATQVAAQQAGNQAAQQALASASGAVPLVGGAVGGIMGALQGDDARSRTSGAIKGVVSGVVSAVAPVGAAVLSVAQMAGANISGNKGANARAGVTYDPERGLTFQRSASGKGSKSMDMLANLPPGVRSSLEASLKAETDKRIASVEGMDPSVVKALGREYFSPSLKIEGEDIAEWNKSGQFHVTENMKRNTGLDAMGNILYSSQTENDLGNAQRLAAHNARTGTSHTIRDLMVAQAEDSRSGEDMYNIGTSQANILDVGNASRTLTEGLDGREATGQGYALRGTGDQMDALSGSNPWA